jgi:hypothetical protein
MQQESPWGEKYAQENWSAQLQFIARGVIIKYGLFKAVKIGVAVKFSKI